MFHIPKSVFHIPKSVFHFLRNRCSTSAEIGVPLRPKYAHKRYDAPETPWLLDE